MDIIFLDQFKSNCPANWPNMVDKMIIIFIEITFSHLKQNYGLWCSTTLYLLKQQLFHSLTQLSSLGVFNVI